MRVLVLLCACAAIAAGCGDGDDSTTTPESGTLVTYARTGGFASMPQSLTVEADGSATVEAGVDPARETFELDPDELEQLRTELEAADFEALEEPTAPTGCADCYAYEVSYGETMVSYDESETVPDSVATVVAHLSDITTAHYPPEATEPPIVN